MGDDEARAAGIALLSKRPALPLRLPAELNDALTFEGVEQLLVFVNPDLVGSTHRGLRFISWPQRRVAARSVGDLGLQNGIAVRVASDHYSHGSFARTPRGPSGRNARGSRRKRPHVSFRAG